MNSDSQPICPACDQPIPEDAPQGLCPVCALAEAAKPTEPVSSFTTGPRFEPPSLDTIAVAFPQLEIIELIGRGGMGAVYRARQENLNREVALKILPPALAELSGFRERFEREAQLLAKLNHPNIVAIYDFGQADGFLYLTMEFVNGVNLRQAMRAGRFTPEQALQVTPLVCEALQFAHEEGVLHRDIKPENILLDERGRVKIVDFGIAKLMGEAATQDPVLTGTSLPGTPHYMAPENFEPESVEVDHRADIFSLGVVLYEMLTGELPLGRFPAPSDQAAVGSQIDEIVFRALNRERELRQQSVDELHTELKTVELATEKHQGYQKQKSDGEKKLIGPGLAIGALLLVVWGLLNFVLFDQGSLFFSDIKNRVLEEKRILSIDQLGEKTREVLGEWLTVEHQFQDEFPQNAFYGPKEFIDRKAAAEIFITESSSFFALRCIDIKKMAVKGARNYGKGFSIFALTLFGILGICYGWSFLQLQRLSDDRRTWSAVVAMLASLAPLLILMTYVFFDTFESRDLAMIASIVGTGVGIFLTLNWWNSAASPED